MKSNLFAVSTVDSNTPWNTPLPSLRGPCYQNPEGKRNETERRDSVERKLLPALLDSIIRPHYFPLVSPFILHPFPIVSPSASLPLFPQPSILSHNLPPFPFLCSLSLFPQSFTFNPQCFSLPSRGVSRGGAKGPQAPLAHNFSPSF